MSLVLYRNWRYEQELDSLLWKIDFREIQVHENEREQQSQKQTRVSRLGKNKKVSLWDKSYVINRLRYGRRCGQKKKYIDIIYHIR